MKEEWYFKRVFKGEKNEVVVVGVKSLRGLLSATPLSERETERLNPQLSSLYCILTATVKTGRYGTLCIRLRYAFGTAVD